MRSVAEEVVHEVEEPGGYVEVFEPLEHQVPLHGVERGAEVNKEYSGQVSWWIKVLEQGVEQVGDGILRSPPGFVGELEKAKVNIICDYGDSVV